MSWTEWTDTKFRNLDLKDLKVDEAFLNVSNAISQKYFLYALSEECVKCPFKKLHNIAKSNDTVIKLDVSRSLQLRMFDKDFGKYAFPNDTSLHHWSAEPELGQFGIYDLKIMSSGAIKFETAKEPVNVHTCKTCNGMTHELQWHSFHLFVSNVALIFVALILVGFYWMCKAVNKFYLSRSPSDAPDEAPQQQSSDNELEMPKVKKRLKSLDIFRGIAIVLMIFVNSGGGKYWWIEHATWNGLHFADLVFPWFLFIMGVCIPMSLKSQVNRQIPKSEIIMKIVQVSNRINIENSLITTNASYFSARLLCSCLDCSSTPPMEQHLGLSEFSACCNASASLIS